MSFWGVLGLLQKAWFCNVYSKKKISVISMA